MDYESGEVARHWGLTIRHVLVLAGFVVGAVLDGFLLSTGPAGSLWLIGWVLEIIFVGATVILAVQFIIILCLWAFEAVLTEWYRVSARLKRIRDQSRNRDE